MDSAKEVNRLKRSFRQADINRDGLLDAAEMGVLLKRGNPSISDEEVKKLFWEINRSQTGKVCFHEFVDYVFKKQPVRKLTAVEKKVQEIRAASDAQMALIGQVEFHGASIHEDLNGTFSKGMTFNGFPVYERGYPEAYIFYAWTADGKKQGWFAASRVPKTGCVTRYKMFNPSSHAMAPHACTAIWRNPAGKLDKLMFCCEVENDAWDPNCRDGTCLDEELWNGTLPEEVSRDPHSWGDNEEAWEQEWQEEPGEGVEDFGLEGYELMYEGAAEQIPDEGAVEVWQDPDFPADASSVGMESGCDAWQRLVDMHPKAMLFSKVRSDDAISHALEGNRWFLSAVACLAEYPAWIVSAFRLNTSLTSNGAYAVRLYHPGKKRFQFVEIDDRVPTTDGSPMSAGISPEGEVWVALLEKAFAKFCGSYKNMQWGSVAYGMLYLCGGGGSESWTKARGGSGLWRYSYTQWNGKADETIDRKMAEGFVQDGSESDQDTLWILLREYMELCYPVAASVDPLQAEASGLMTQLAYSVIGAREVTLEQGVLRMVRLRNPHGFSRWTQRWSDESDAWDACPAAQHQLRFKPRGDGTLWMAYSDFCKFFEVVDVVRKSMPVQGCKAAKLQGAIRGLRKSHYE